MKKLSPALRQARKLAKYYRNEYTSFYKSEFATSAKAEEQIDESNKLPWEKSPKKKPIKK